MDKNEGNSNLSHDDAVRKLAELIHDIEFAMFTTNDGSGHLRSRPMATQKTPFDGDLWFFTSDQTPKSFEIKQDQRVNLSYARPKGHQLYVSVSGRAELVKDRAKIAELWNPAYKAWFPDGLDSPDICLIRVKVDQAEYWDTPSSPVAHLIGLTKAILKHERAHDLGDHRKLDMAH